ncbi:hypothetical protein ACS0TY_005867 [Phlomoides rotata]
MNLCVFHFLLAMDYESHSAVWPPECWCEKGKMDLRQEGTIKNPGRYFYACPRNLVHPHYFVWCDVYHHNDPPHAFPHFLRYPNPMRNASTQQFGSSTSFPNCNPSTPQYGSSTSFPNCNPSPEASEVLTNQPEVREIANSTNGQVHHMTCAIDNHHFYVGCVIWSILIAVMGYCIGKYSL